MNGDSRINERRLQNLCRGWATLNYPHVIAVTKWASQASTQLRNRATPTSVFINAPRVPVRCGCLGFRPGGSEIVARGVLFTDEAARLSGVLP
jgi:hypothetical protein